MAFCPNCGSQLEENSTFCTNCGTKINNNTTNTDNTTNTTNTTNTDNTTNTTNTEAIAKSLNQINFGKTFNLIKDSAIKPISGSCKFISETNKEETFFVAILFTLIQGIIGMWKVSTLIRLVKESSDSTSSTIYAVLNLLSSVSVYSHISYGKIFIQNCVLYLVYIAPIFICIFLIISVIFHTHKKASSFFKLALISTLPFLISEILSIIFSYIFPLLGCIILIGGIIYLITVLTLLIKNTYNSDDNKTVFLVTISFIISALILFSVWSEMISS